MNSKRNWTIGLLGLALCGAAAADPTNAPTKTDYAYFKIIPERNIFNPNRYPTHHGASSTAAMPATSTNAFTLVGTMSYEKGTFAFFAGATAEYQKVLQKDDTIAGFRVAAIQPNGVRLIANGTTNVLAVPVGAQLQRDAETGWTLVAEPATQTVLQAEAPTNDAGSAPNDVLKKLMQKREQELQ